MKTQNHNEVKKFEETSLKVRYLIHFGFWSFVCTLIAGAHLFKWESEFWVKSEHPALMLLGYALFFGLGLGAILAIISYKKKTFS